MGGAICLSHAKSTPSFRSMQKRVFSQEAKDDNGLLLGCGGSHGRAVLFGSETIEIAGVVADDEPALGGGGRGQEAAAGFVFPSLFAVR